MEIAVLTSKGQIVIPKKIRSKYGIKTGSRIAFIETKAGLMIRPMDDDYFESFAGLLVKEAPSAEEYMAWKKEDLDKEVAKTENKFTK